MSPSSVRPPGLRPERFSTDFIVRFRRRVWLVVLLCVAAAAVGWLLVRGDPKIYERELTYLIRPSPALDDSAYSDALSTIDREETGVEPTLLRIIGRPEFLAEAVNQTGEDASATSLRPTIRPGSNIVDITLRSSDRAFLGPLGTSVADLAEDWIDTTYGGAYRIDPLLVTDRPDAVAPDVSHAIEVGGLIGAAAGLLIVFLETLAARAGAGQRRSRRAGVRL